MCIMSKLSHQEIKDKFIDKIKKIDTNSHTFSDNDIQHLELFLPQHVKESFLLNNGENGSYQALMPCCTCGKSVELVLENGEEIIKDKCEFVFKDLEVEVDFSSGKIVNADYLVSIAEYITERGSIGFQNSHKNLFLRLEHFAKYKVFFPSIPNGQPSLYGEDGDYILAEGTDNDDEDVISWSGISPKNERLGCFFIDYDKALRMKDAFNMLEEHFEGFEDINELEIIEVPKGIYKCKVVKESMYNRKYVNSDVFVVGSMKLIK